MKKLAYSLANSVALKKGKEIWGKNQKDGLLKLTKYEKAITGAYLILLHYSQGKFPPTFDDQSATYSNEINFRETFPGHTVEQMSDRQMRKPFWFNRNGRRYLKNFAYLCGLLGELGIEPPDKILELGCGTGWMAEFLSTMKYNVKGTTVSNEDIKDANKRKRSLSEKGLHVELEFIATPMETVSTAISGDAKYRCVFVYEALHHAFDWKKTLHSAYQCLGQDGWMILCNEPNALHTFTAYRGAVLANAHEIGFKRNELVAVMREIGYRKIKTIRGRFGFRILPLWIAGQK